MSLDVPAALLERAEAGRSTTPSSSTASAQSLPYAWAVVSDVAGRLAGRGGEFADHAMPPPSEAERGQLLRALASDAIRGGLERHFGVQAGVPELPPGRRVPPVRRRRCRRTGSSSRRAAQLRNQSPELRDC